MGTYAEAAAPARDVSRRRRSIWSRISRDGLSTLVFLLPFLLIFGVFSWFPIARAFVMSVQETNLVSDPIFVGLDNFARVLADPLLGIAVRNTAWFAFLALIIGFPIPIILAVLISETRRHRGLYSALVYLPVVVPPVVSVLLWRFFFDAAPTGRLQHHPRLDRLRARCRGSRTRAARCHRSSWRRRGRPPAGR